jgi:hypothetical protein
MDIYIKLSKYFCGETKDILNLNGAGEISLKK